MSATLWVCPKCKRRFGKKKQWHSCASYSVGDHFKNKLPILRETFNLLFKQTQNFGAVRTDAVKSLITLSGQYHFAAVYVLKNSLTIEFVLERKISDDRIVKTQKLLNRYSYFIKLNGPDDVDAQLIDWLAEAYYLTSSPEKDEKPTLFKRKR